jgi:hypothetical protein
VRGIMLFVINGARLRTVVYLTVTLHNVPAMILNLIILLVNRVGSHMR